MSDSSTTSPIAWTPEDRARHRAIREQFQRARPTPEQLLAGGDYVGPIPLGVYIDLKSALRELRKSREAAGVSLDELAIRLAVDRETLDHFEGDVDLGSPIELIVRYAAALGKRLSWTLEDFPTVPTSALTPT